MRNTAMACLDTLVSEYAARIHDYTTTPTAFTRNRKLNAETMLKVTLNMQGNSLNAELLDAFPDAEQRMSASAYEQAKAKLTPKLFEDMFYDYNRSMMSPKTLKVADEYRVFAIDGTAINVPYNSLSEYVVKYSESAKKKDGSNAKPYSILHANMMYDIMNRTYHDFVIQPRNSANERDAAIDMLKRLDVDKSIVIMDRGYDGFNMIETCNRIPNLHYVIRTRISGGIREVKDLPEEECDVEMCFPVTTYRGAYMQNQHKGYHYMPSAKKHYKETFSKNTKNKRWDFEKYVEVKCRVVKFRIRDEEGQDAWEVLLTNLNRFEFPIEKMKELYHMRWDIETSFSELKYALGAINFHSKKDDFVLMELFSHFIMFNAVSRSISEIQVPQKDSRKHKYAINFKMAVQLTRKYFRTDCVLPPENLGIEMLMYLLPIRPGRKNQRNLKAKSAVPFVYRVA